MESRNYIKPEADCPFLKYINGSTYRILMSLSSSLFVVGINSRRNGGYPYSSLPSIMNYNIASCTLVFGVFPNNATFQWVILKKIIFTILFGNYKRSGTKFQGRASSLDVIWFRPLRIVDSCTS